MNRRTFIGAAVTASVAGCGGNNNQKETATPDVETAENVPDGVKKVRELAQRYHDALVDVIDEPRVFINKNGEIVLEYQSSAKTEESLETEMYQLADLFVDQIQTEEEATTLSVIVEKVQLVAPKPSVLAYYNDNLERKAFFKTIEVIPVER